MTETPYKLLVVDDDDQVLNYIVMHFRRAGLEVTGVLDGVTALDTLTRDTFDLLITDLMLPRMNGFELVKRVRETLPDIPIILLTGGSYEDSEMTGVEIGINDFLAKPFSMFELEARVKKLLRARERT